MMIRFLILSFIGAVCSFAGVSSISGSAALSGAGSLNYNAPAPPAPPPAPNTISNLVLALDGASVSGISDGGNVTSWVDPYTAQTVTPPGTAPKKRTLETYSVVRFAGSDRLVSGSILDSTFNTNFTLITVTRAITNAASQFYASYSGTTVSFAESQSANTRANAWFGVVGASMTPSYGQVVSYVYNGVDVKLYRNKVLHTTATKTNDLGMSGTLSLGALSTAANPLYGDMRRLYLYNRALTSNEINTVADFAYYYDTGFAGMDTFLFVGDSQTGTVGGTITYVDVVRTNLASSGAVYNYIQTHATSGWTTTNAFTNLNDLKYIGLPNLARTNIIVMWIGTNNDTASTTAATIRSDIAQLAYKYRTNNCKVAWLTMLKKTGNDDSVRQAVNSAIRASPSTFYIDKVVPIEDDARLQDPTDTTYFADGLHLTNAGKIAVGELTAPYLHPW